MVGKIVKFLASRHQQNTSTRLKSHNQDYISWRGIFNMLKSWRSSGWVSIVSGIPSPLSFAPMETLYATDTAHNK